MLRDIWFNTERPRVPASLERESWFGLELVWLWVAAALTVSRNNGWCSLLFILQTECWIGIFNMRTCMQVGSVRKWGGSFDFSPPEHRNCCGDAWYVLASTACWIPGNRVYHSRDYFSPLSHVELTSILNHAVPCKKMVAAVSLDSYDILYKCSVPYLYFYDESSFDCQRVHKGYACMYNYFFSPECWIR